MDAYFPVVSKSLPKGKGGSRTVISKTCKDEPEEPKIVRRGSGLEEVSIITKSLLENLSDVSNPITHSNIVERTDHIVSFATGHQVSDGRRNQTAHMADRAGKLRAQREDNKSNSDSGILQNIKIYINGYLESTTDIEIKRLVSQAGGQVVYSASQCTHIITSRCLSASKSNRIMTRKTRSNVYVVKPAWVLDSIAIGKRRPERPYAIVRSNASHDFLES